jgi:hypothetical protein
LINDAHLTAGKTFTLTERIELSFYARAFNVFNHARWVGGFINDVPRWIHPSAVFSSNPRTMQWASKFSF